MPEKDLVNHPSHYNKPGRKECWDEMADRYSEPWVCIYDIVTAYKYVYRAGSKDGNDYYQDIAKALAYLNHAKSLLNALYTLRFKTTVLEQCEALEKEIAEML